MAETLQHTNLSAKALQYLRYFAIMPSNEIAFGDLMELFRINRKHEDVTFFDTIHDLSTDGWLQSNGKYYSMDSDMRHTLQEQLSPDAKKCQILIETITQKLQDKELNNSQKAYYASFAESIIEHIIVNSASVAILGNSLISFLLENEEYEKAIRYSPKAIEAAERYLPRNHSELGVAYKNAASAYRRQKKTGKVLEYMLRYVKIREIELSDNHPEMAFHFYNLALLYYDLTDLANAKYYIDKAVYIDGRNLGTDHPDYQNDLNVQKRINTVYRISEHLHKYLKWYLILILIGIIIPLLILLIN